MTSSKPKQPTMREKIEVYEQLLHDLHFHSSVTMNHQAVMALLNKISSWSYAHRQGNGEYSEKEQNDVINHAFWNLDKR
jgi:hypothetical protein